MSSLISGQSVYRDNPVAAPQLSAVKCSPLDERLSSLGGSISSLNEEIEMLRKQLEPVTIPGAGEKNDASKAAPSPVECNIEHAIRGADERIFMASHALSALRAQLRV